ncbi:MAG: WxcM-like domain-containing protein [Spirulinaceae cyanobacterium SM2_1_0]|nr:WxcM-like domain-containing protein [Spirulinaceae cyanobacterium SM2_1_0]
MLSTLGPELLLEFPAIGSPEEGYLAIAEFEKSCPFPIARTYWVYGCPENMQRGGHAHHRLSQLLVCVAGEVEVTLNDGTEKQIFLLNQPTVGLLQKPLVWGDLRYRNQAVLVVLASHPYAAEDYIRDYQHFLALTNV